MDRRVAIVAIVLCVILALLMRGRGTTIIQEASAPDIVLGGANISTFEVPSIATPPSLPKYSGGTWDWMQTTNLMCGCDTDYKPQILLEPPPPPPARPSISYVFLNPPPLELPPAAPVPSIAFPPASVAYKPPLPAPVVAASKPTYQWAWDGLQRVVILSNGTKLKAGLDNRKFVQNNDGTITYAGFQYWPA